MLIFEKIVNTRPVKGGPGSEAAFLAGGLSAPCPIPAAPRRRSGGDCSERHLVFPTTSTDLSSGPQILFISILSSIIPQDHELLVLEIVGHAEKWQDYPVNGWFVPQPASEPVFLPPPRGPWGSLMSSTRLPAAWAPMSVYPPRWLKDKPVKGGITEPCASQEHHAGPRPAWRGSALQLWVQPAL